MSTLIALSLPVIQRVPGCCHFQPDCSLGDGLGVTLRPWRYTVDQCHLNFRGSLGSHPSPTETQWTRKCLGVRRCPSPPDNPSPVAGRRGTMEGTCAPLVSGTVVWSRVEHKRRKSRFLPGLLLLLLCASNVAFRSETGLQISIHWGKGW